MKPRWSQTKITAHPRRVRAIRREMARAGTLAHHQSEALLRGPLVLPEGADPELARIFGLRERP